MFLLIQRLYIFIGNLALSRALGDFKFKKNEALIPEKQIITADPEVTVHDITDEDEFLVIACDGTLSPPKKKITVTADIHNLTYEKVSGTACPHNKSST